MNKFLVFLISLLVIGGGYYYFRHPLGKKIIVNGHTISVELAITDAEKQKGLGERDSLAQDNGMLFVYQNKDRYGYWMKGMRFPLDYMWIDGNRVVDLSSNIPAPTAPGQVPVELAPKVPVDKVLEVNAGMIAKLGVKIGDTVRYSD